MLLVSEAVTRAALERQESRGGHTRDDYPMTDPYWGSQNVVLEMDAAASSPSRSTLTVRRQALPKPPPELAELLEEVH
jgi:succinate dehydrogenase / fumarate reductase flavoprotein subunit